MKRIIAGIALFIIIVLAIAYAPFGVIQAGQRGVVFSNISGIENRILGEGTYWRNPFIENVTSMPVQTQATQFDENAGTSDSQSVDVKLTLNWHLNPARVNKIYQNIGTVDAVVSNVLTPNTQDAVKAATSKYVALEIQKNRDNVSTRALTILQGKLKQYNIIVDTLSITNIDFSPQFRQAIENAQSAAQNAVAATNNANAVIAKANGDAEAQRVQQQTLTPLFVENKLVDGLASGNIKLPTTLILGPGQNLSQFLLSTPASQ